LKESVMATSGEFSYDAKILVIQTNKGRNLNIPSYLYSKRTIKNDYQHIVIANLISRNKH